VIGAYGLHCREGRRRQLDGYGFMLRPSRNWNRPAGFSPQQTRGCHKSGKDSSKQTYSRDRSHRLVFSLTPLPHSQT
jgi:hypothetical protein